MLKIFIDKIDDKTVIPESEIQKIKLSFLQQLLTCIGDKLNSPATHFKGR